MKTQKHTQRWKQVHTHTNENKHICTHREIKTQKDKKKKTQRWKHKNTYKDENKCIHTQMKTNTYAHTERLKHRKIRRRKHKDENTKTHTKMKTSTHAHTQRWKHTHTKMKTQKHTHTIAGNMNMNPCTLITAGLQSQMLDTLTTIRNTCQDQPSGSVCRILNGGSVAQYIHAYVEKQPQTQNLTGSTY